MVTKTMSKYIKLSDSQKDEIRRLTQLANRRIRAAAKAYQKEGMEVLPYDIAGHYQIKEQWNTKANPISRSVKFESQRAYRKQLQFLRSFETQKMGIKEYSKVQQDKTILAMETSLGTDVPESLVKKIEKMNAPQLSKFWNTFTDKSIKLAQRYSSNDAMTLTLSELFPEDLKNIA